ncbi:extracellular solute-binding protein [candidate division KSB1 bacterium]|nr:extracellular solute-binding protein [candidate division KSB1 bacterium]
MVILFGACQSERKDSGSGKMVYWSSNNQDEINLAREVVAEWNALHPEIQVKHQPVPEGESSEEVILAAVVGKTTPDIYSNMWPGDVASYVRAGQLVNFDQFSNFDSVTSERFSPGDIEQSRSKNGHVYQILWKTNPVMLIFNTKMFGNAGVHEPRTYTEYLEAGKRISRDTDGDGYVDRWVGITDIRARWRDRLFDFYPLYIAASGGKTLIENGEVTFDNKFAVGVFQFYRDIYKNDYFPKEIATGRRDFFLNELAGSRVVGPWEVMHTEKFKPEGFQYDFIHVPVPCGTREPIYTYGDLKGIVVFKNSKYPRHAWEFIQFMINRKNDLRLLELATQLPLRQNILEDTLYQNYFDNNPKMVKFAHQAKYIRNVDESPTLKEVFDAISQEFEACVVYGAKTPEQAVHDAAVRSKLVLE